MTYSVCFFVILPLYLGVNYDSIAVWVSFGWIHVLVFFINHCLSQLKTANSGILYFFQCSDTVVYCSLALSHALLSRKVILVTSRLTKVFF